MYVLGLYCTFFYNCAHSPLLIEHTIQTTFEYIFYLFSFGASWIVRSEQYIGFVAFLNITLLLNSPSSNICTFNLFISKYMFFAE
jgi:hypothetical protein